MKRWTWDGTPDRETRKAHLRIVATAMLSNIARDGYIDQKRPFRNRGVASDVAEMIGLTLPAHDDDGWGAVQAYCSALYDSWAESAHTELRAGRPPTPRRASLESRVAALEVSANGSGFVGSYVSTPEEDLACAIILSCGDDGDEAAQTYAGAARLLAKRFPELRAKYDRLRDDYINAGRVNTRDHNRWEEFIDEAEAARTAVLAVAERLKACGGSAFVEFAAELHAAYGGSK